jgi:hypothetical protein
MRQANRCRTERARGARARRLRRGRAAPSERDVLRPRRVDPARGTARPRGSAVLQSYQERLRAGHRSVRGLPRYLGDGLSSTTAIRTPTRTTPRVPCAGLAIVRARSSERPAQSQRPRALRTHRDSLGAGRHRARAAKTRPTLS